METPARGAATRLHVVSPLMLAVLAPAALVL